jgi:hypothetical protein
MVTRPPAMLLLLLLLHPFSSSPGAAEAAGRRETDFSSRSAAIVHDEAALRAALGARRMAQDTPLTVHVAAMIHLNSTLRISAQHEGLQIVAAAGGSAAYF